MQKNKYKGIDIENALKKAKIDLEEYEENLVINNIIENENEVEIEVIEKREIINYINNCIKELLSRMGFSIEVDIEDKEETPKFIINSNRDALLIGKNGKNLKSLNIIIKEMLKKELKTKFQFIIDVSKYNQKRVEYLKKLAINISKEVKKTRIEAKLDSMNSYERMIIHIILKNDRYVYTESTGEEPNRHIIIKPKED